MRRALSAYFEPLRPGCDPERLAEILHTGCETDL
jgi:hypothetical protein